MLNVFVYGTLKPGEINYNRYCQGRVVEQTKAWTRGQLYHLPRLGYPGMVRCRSGRVEGYLLTFAESSILTILDRLEDYLPERSPQENEYNRHWISVYQLHSQQKLTEAWGYTMAIETVKQWQGVLISSGWWNSGSTKLLS